jgi:cyclic lactone autoinducer peptide
MKKIEKLIAKLGYNTAKKTVNSASAWHCHQVKEPSSARERLMKEAVK